MKATFEGTPEQFRKLLLLLETESRHELPDLGKMESETCEESEIRLSMRNFFNKAD